jgi:acyl-CoA synthetase (NDP forming)
MFGLGGILTEILKDTVFRIAPLTMRDAREMMGEIRASKILEPFRGEAAADLDILAKA